MMDAGDLEAVILDMDGVVTRTARLHARAWKRLFDEYLEARAQRTGEDWTPFDAVSDYNTYVDGKPREDGVRSFLAARGIELPEGERDDGPDRETIRGLGARKDGYFHEILQEEGVEVYQDAVDQVRAWRARGLPVAIVSSSRNCRAILERAGLTGLFDVRIDGVEAERRGLAGKPAADIFLEAARELGADPARTLVLEDAVSGVRAGRAGEFGRVVGVDRGGKRGALLEAGADLVVTELDELDEVL